MSDLGGGFTPDGLEDDDPLKRQTKIGAPNAVDSSTPMTLRGVLPKSQPAAPAAPPNPETGALAKRTAADELENQRLERTGSGISQIQHGSPEGGIGIGKPHRILGGILRGLDIAGSAIAPGIAENIPGTELHHEVLQANSRRNLGEDIEQGGRQANTEHTEAETNEIPAAQANLEATTAHTNAETNALNNPEPKSTFEKTADGSIVQITTDPQGNSTTKEVYKGDPKVETDLADLQVGGELHKVLVNKQTGAQIKDLGKTKGGEGSEGTWSLQEDANGKPILLNSKTGESKPAPAGVQARGTHQKQQDAYEKNVAVPKADLSYADDYIKNGVFTGPGDEALMEKFFDLAKPSTGFRMSQPQIDMLAQARSWLGGAEAHIRHATSGTWFSDEQRQQIYATMQAVANAKIKATGGENPIPQAGGNAQDPLGIR